VRLFRDRREAGRALAEVLRRERPADPVVLALPRGGVPVGREVASVLRAPLEVLVARKVGAPGEPEVGMGAVAEGGGIFVDRDLVSAAGVTERDLAARIAREREEVARRVRAYRGDRPLPALAGRTAIVVDDGVARGGTARAALRAVRALGPGRLLLAAPVIAGETIEDLRGEADRVVCVEAPLPFVAVGCWYEDFAQTGEDEVLAILAAARAEALRAR
jgi:putative phosphoribosyl transferase